MYLKIFIAGIITFVFVLITDKHEWKNHLVRLVYFLIGFTIFYYILDILFGLFI